MLGYDFRNPSNYPLHGGRIFGHSAFDVTLKLVPDNPYLFLNYPHRIHGAAVASRLRRRAVGWDRPAWVCLLHGRLHGNDGRFLVGLHLYCDVLFRIARPTLYRSHW